MTWKFHLVAAKGQSLFLTVLQILESQRVRVRAFYGDSSDCLVCVIATVTSEEDKLSRIQALLYNLQEVKSVFVFHDASEVAARSERILEVSKSHGIATTNTSTAVVWARNLNLRFPTSHDGLHTR